MTQAKTFLDYRPANNSPDDILDAFLTCMIDRDIELYDAQEQAVLEICEGKHLILNTPTGSGKSLVAVAAHFKAICEGKRTFYTCPIKALVSEKFFSLCKDFGAENVGMMTGDASINKDAPIICCTAEILSNMAVNEGQNASIQSVVMDEFHYYSDKERGVAWQLPLLMMPNCAFVLMSATLGDIDFIRKDLEEKSGREVAVVKSTERPVPLDFKYALTPLHETIEGLIDSERSPIYIVQFTQRACAEQAQKLMSLNFTTKEKKKEIKDALAGFRFDSAYGKDMRRFTEHGLGLHHAGLLPKYRLMVEQLSQKGLLKVICGTDTLGVGVNVPIRTVLFSQLCKYDGEKTGILSVRDFKQISGRAGRKGFDTAGTVVAQAPEHVIDNLRLDAKAAADPKKKKKLVKKKPPERGYVHWDESTFQKLQDNEPERLHSRFKVDHSLMLDMMQSERGGAKGYRALIELIASSHDDKEQKRAHRKRGAQLFKSLRGAGIIEVSKGVVTIDESLQLEFSLFHTLSLYLVEALALLDKETDTYPLDVLSLVESVLEHPRVILRQQVSKLKTEKMQEMKAEGIEYDERMAELEKIDYEKPCADFIYQTFNDFCDKHPWVGHENIRPKSIARAMFEDYAAFTAYIKELGLARAEGILLRYLSQAYKTLVQSVPSEYKTPELEEIAAYLRTEIVNIDSSLVNEWERMLEGGDAEDGSPAERDDVERTRAVDLVTEVRALMHAFVRALSRKEYEAAALLLGEGSLSAKELEGAMAGFYEDYRRVIFDPRARAPRLTKIEDAGEGSLTILHTLLDDEEDNMWCVHAEGQGSNSAEPSLIVTRIGT